MQRKTKLLCAVLIAAAAGPAFAARNNPPATSAPAADNTQVDNTRVNQRDRNADATTPGDQPNDSADIKLAAAVRQAIEKDRSLSMMAHNVKLVASAGVVTLRGPVANSGEKKKVHDLAAQVSGVTRVENQLDVKAE